MNLLDKIKYWLKAKSSGLLELPHDERDWHWRDLFGQYEPKIKVKELFPYWQKNQRGRSNCTFQAWSNALGEYFGEEVSARWLTSKAYQQGLCQKDGWADLRAGGKVAQKFGVVFEKDLTSDENATWDWYVNIDFAKFDEIAKQNKIPSYVKIDSVSEYIEAIDTSRPVVLGRQWRTSMNAGGGFKAPWIITQAIRKMGISIGGHSTLGRGYDMDKNVTKELNSYGDWGYKGHFFCDLNDLQSDMDTFGAYAITDIEYTPKDIKINSLKKLLNEMILALKGLMARESFYKTALTAYRTGEVLVKDIPETPYNDMDLGCALNMSRIWSRTFPDRAVNFSSTSQWHKYFKDNEGVFFEGILQPEPMCFILYATDSIPPQSPLKNGHLFLNGKNKSDDGSYWTLSNNSKTGKLDTHFTVKSADEYYHKNGKIPPFYYKIIK